MPVGKRVGDDQMGDGEISSGKLMCVGKRGGDNFRVQTATAR